MAELTVEKVYADALFQAAGELGRESEILSEALTFAEIFRKEPEFRIFLTSPVISPAEKKEFLVRILADRISETFLHFLFVLIDKGRVRALPGITETLKKLSDRTEGFVEGTVFSVEPLEENRLKQIETETGRLLRKNVRLENVLDPGLIGGVRIRIDGKIIDASLRKRLERFREAML